MASRRSSKASVKTAGSTSSAAAIARAKAEAAKVRASYASKEAKLKVEKAENQLETVKIDAELEVLNLQKEADAAVAEADVLEKAEEWLMLDETGGSVSEKAMEERVKDYVHSQNELQWQPLHPKQPENIQPQTDSMENHTTLHLPANEDSQLNSMHKLKTHKDDSLEDRTMSNPNMNIDAPIFRPQYDPSSFHQPEPEPVALYLARRELVNSGLYHYDDKPENYRAWFSSFFSAVNGLQLTPTQELDLMTKWLGKNSSELVKRIRSVHINNPIIALKKAWERLQESYAAPEILENSLFQRLERFPKINAKENVKLRELADLLQEIEGAKEDGYLTGLSYLDTPRGIAPIVDKLPFGLQERWVSNGSFYKEENHGRFPPFEHFCKFVSCEAKRRNDPSFMYQSSLITHTKPVKYTPSHFIPNRAVSVHKTTVSTTNAEPNRNCPLHNKPHPLKKCRTFQSMPYNEKKAFLKENGICFKCCSSTSHLARSCTSTVKCSECGSSYHDAAMHPDSSQRVIKAPSAAQEDGGEGEAQADVINTSCTEVCGPGQWNRSCSKICLVRIYPKGAHDKAIKAYVMLDDQSNRSLARSELFDLFNIQSSSCSYYLRTCSGVTETAGRKADAFQIESLDGKVVICLPSLLECNDILNNRSEIPTPSTVSHQPHLRRIAKHIPDLDPNAEILLLLGRDAIRVHKVREQISGPHNAPFAQRLDLGWVVVGDVCLGSVHKPIVNTFKTNVLENGRYSMFQPCMNFINAKETKHEFEQRSSVNDNLLGQSVFIQTAHDNKPAPSVEDEIFLKLMDAKVYRDEDNSWVAPLPFKEPRQRLPNNIEQAISRFTSLKRSMKRKPEMQQQYVEFMGKILANRHAEVAPKLNDNEECWYLPTFGVFHPQKPGQIRVVFDSSAQWSGISLNDVLLKGPDLNNSLLGVLLRFRKEKVAVLADIQQMFYCFLVQEDHRNFLRFLWHKDNDVNKEVVEYRMNVHVFGNSPSPAVAVYGLRRAIRQGAQEYGDDTVKFVERHFYVDDGLISVPTEAEAIDLLRRTQASLAESNLRLHKLVSNCQAVVQAFSPKDCAVVKNMDLSEKDTPTQRSLGLLWEIRKDTFTFSVPPNNKLFTRRGVLSTVNSIFDPLGLIAPVTIQGRALLRELTSEQSDWDTPLPADKHSQWESWKDSLQDLKHLHIPRMYTATSLREATYKELCVFSDASVKAIGAVAYLRTVQEHGRAEVGFVMGKAKLAPQSVPTVPRLELCAAVLAVEMADLIQDELDIKLDAIKFYTDSKVVLGYIFNKSKRFYLYVHNRVQRIHMSSRPEQWNYVHTEENPADHASRSVSAPRLAQTSWFTGPAFLSRSPVEDTQPSPFELMEPEADVEIRPEVQTCVTFQDNKVLRSDRFQRFSTFTSLVRAITSLIHIAKSYNHSVQNSKCKGWHICNLRHTQAERDQAKTIIFKATQRSSFPKECTALQSNKAIPINSCLKTLNPKLGNDLLLVGGRLKHSTLLPVEKNPIILPKHNHISLLLTRHYHEQVKHQGRHLTEGAIRAAGLWILGGKQLVNSVLHKCVICRKLRGKQEQQQMSDLPPERLQVCPPFTYVGLDVFGPWSVNIRRTRGGQADSKRWAIMFSCMSSRAVHIEVIESMDTSSCINALRRFFSLRGPAKQLRSDCGTNFIGASKELGLDRTVQSFLSEHGCSWVFNPPHASHMGGSWERMIGVARRILDSMFLQQNVRLTHEVLCTLMAEVTAVINGRPLVPVSTDPDNPFILSPSMILTQKVGVPPPLGEFSEKDLYTKQWRQVQTLANQFWGRWKREYLHTLQRRQKWTEIRRKLEVGDLVLLKDNQVPRNSWPMARITATFPGEDGFTRKVELQTSKGGNTKTFLRPVTEVILLMP